MKSFMPVLALMLFLQPGASPEHKFQFTVIPERTSNVSGDGCYIIFKLVNAGEKRVAVYSPLVASGTIKLELLDENGRHVRLQNQPPASMTAQREYLGPNDTIVNATSLEVWFGRQDSLVRTPLAGRLPAGKYELRATYRVAKNEDINAPPVTFYVAEPVGDERVVFSKLQDAISDSYRKRDSAAVIYRAFSGITQNYKSSLYRPQAMFRLMDEYVRHGDTLRCKEYAEQMVREYPGSVATYGALSRLMSVIKTPEERFSLLRTILTKHGNTFLGSVARYWIKSVERELWWKKAKQSPNNRK